MNSTIVKNIRKAESEIIEIEKNIMWHERALRHRGFSNYSGLMTREEIQDSLERRKGLKSFIQENRKTIRTNGK
jgi:hypothetical protein